MWPNLKKKTAALAAFTDILNRKLHLLCRVSLEKKLGSVTKLELIEIFLIW